MLTRLYIYVQEYTLLVIKLFLTLFTYIYIYIYNLVNIYICINIYVYIHIQIHIHIYTYMLTRLYFGPHLIEILATSLLLKLLMIWPRLKPNEGRLIESPSLLNILGQELA
jgi:hypothetical protein